MSAHFVYVLKSDKDGRLYVGMTSNLDRRLSEHINGNVFSTKGYRPWKLVFHEHFPSRDSARKREKYLKSGSGKEWLKKKFLPP
ncbi:MAG: GIY-YIG nuclease family protein [Bacteroidia bacterium]|nr:GIY-YIG nuclease family protein [Bacteroidia bacterium]